MNRDQIGNIVAEKLKENLSTLKKQYESSGVVRHFYIDDVLPEELARQVYEAFPDPKGMRLRKSLRELKFISAQMNSHSSVLEEALFAFQIPEVVDQIAKITGLKNLESDSQLYAGGISMMARGHFLNPHLDNSHDKDQDKYRVLNLLYYASPSWKLENGGNLEVWPEGPKKSQVTIESKFNRLVVMITNSKSWHSVSPITVDENRCCVSNYYFSQHPAESAEYRHVTTFRGRPEQKIRDLLLQLDGSLRQGLRKIAPKGMFKVTHYYKKDGSAKK